jgi:hypothetical protein
MTLTRREFASSLLALFPAGLLARFAPKSKVPAPAVLSEFEQTITFLEDTQGNILRGRLVYMEPGEPDPQIVRWTVPANMSEGEIEIAKLPAGATILSSELELFS